MCSGRNQLLHRKDTPALRGASRDKKLRSPANSRVNEPPVERPLQPQTSLQVSVMSIDKTDPTTEDSAKSSDWEEQVGCRGDQVLYEINVPQASALVNGVVSFLGFDTKGAQEKVPCLFVTKP